MNFKLRTYHKYSNLIRIKILLRVQITDELVVILSITLSHNNPNFIFNANRNINIKLGKTRGSYSFLE